MKDTKGIILVLEDNSARVDSIRSIVDSLPRAFELRDFDAVGALRALPAADFARVRLISLDFSLDSSSAPLPGTGMDAVQFLNQRGPVCPVIVHTASTGDSRKMAEALTKQGWRVRQVSFGSRDRAEKWRAAAMELLGLAAGKA